MINKYIYENHSLLLKFKIKGDKRKKKLILFQKNKNKLLN